MPLQRVRPFPVVPLYNPHSQIRSRKADTGLPHVVMKDAPKKQPETPTTQSNPTNPTNPTTPATPTTETAKETPTTPKTGDDRNPLIWLLLLGLGGGMAGSVWFLRKKGKEEQNQD